MDESTVFVCALRALLEENNNNKHLKGPANQTINMSTLLSLLRIERSGPGITLTFHVRLFPIESTTR
jgi:hypothetical protein